MFADAVTYRTEGRKRKKKKLYVTIEIGDDVEMAVEGASVSIDPYRDSSKVASGAGATDSQGTVTFRLKRARSGSYSTTVTGVTAAEFVWDGETPPNEFSF